MTSSFFEYDDNPKGRCDDCCDCRIVYANGGWSFKGCYHEPYYGKWVAEIKDCPKEYEAAVEAAQYNEMYEPTYDPETGAL